MFGQNKHYCLKICNQPYLFAVFQAMAAAPPDIYRCYHCERCYEDVEHLFVHNKEVHYDVETNFSILCGESGSSKYRALHFNRPVHKFPPNSSVTFEGGKLIVRVQSTDNKLSPPSKYGKQSDTPIKDYVNNLSDTYSVSASDVQPDLDQLARELTHMATNVKITQKQTNILCHH